MRAVVSAQAWPVNSDDLLFFRKVQCVRACHVFNIDAIDAKFCTMQALSIRNIIATKAHPLRIRIFQAAPICVTLETHFSIFPPNVCCDMVQLRPKDIAVA